MKISTACEAVKGDPVELAVLLAAFYGLRRGEIVGLQWQAINFQNQTLTIQFYKSSYSNDYKDYNCVDRLGQLIKPGYITQHFPIVLEKHNWKRIRFHDLRHSCASLLLANGVNMKDIQEWLGHSHYSTTAYIYAHLDYSSKISSAQVMSITLQIPIMQKAPESSQGQIQELVNC